MPESPATPSTNPSLATLLPFKLNAYILSRTLRFWGQRVLTDPRKGVSLGYIHKQAHWSVSSMTTLLGHTTRATPLLELTPIFGRSSPSHGAHCLGSSVLALSEALTAG